MAKRKVLVIRLSALGDVAMTVPVVKAVAQQWPDVELTVLTRPFFARLFGSDKPENVKIREIDLQGRHRGARGLLRLGRELQAEGYDMVADLHNLLRSRTLGAMLRLSGARVATVDKARGARRRLTRRHGKDRTPQRSYIDRYCDVFARLGLPVELPAMIPSSGEHAGVGIAPFARYATKTYPPEMMQKVVGQLVASGERVLLFGARGDEAAVLEQWAASTGAECVAGRLSLEEEIALMGSLKVMVTMDSANMHLASLAGVPVVSVWGGTTPECGFLGYGQSLGNAVVAGLDCQPCSIAGTPECPLGTLACMHAIAPEAIVDRIKAITGR